MIRLNGISQRFGGLMAVSDLSFEVEKGEVMGFVGANGSGKTTSMRIMATLDLPYAGHAEIAGFDVVKQPSEVRRRLGWMPDHHGSYKRMPVWEYLDFFARAYGLTGARRRQRLETVIGFTGLSELLRQSMETLSKGQSQRLSLARCLIHDPEVLILDEPAAGLDPKARLELKRLLRLLADENKTILISSHILSELKEVSDRLVFIHKGQLQREGRVEVLLKDKRERTPVDIRVKGSPEPLYAWIADHPRIRLLDKRPEGALIEVEAEREGELEGDTEAQLSTLLASLVGAGIRIKHFSEVEESLEAIFVKSLDKAEA